MDVVFKEKWAWSMSSFRNYNNIMRIIGGSSGNNGTIQEAVQNTFWRIIATALILRAEGAT